jgi:hypothetical protein
MKRRKKKLEQDNKENNLTITQNEKIEIAHMQKAQCTHLKKSMNCFKLLNASWA